MTSVLKLLIGGVIFLLIACSHADQAASAPVGEIIVKFAEGNETDDLVVDAFADDSALKNVGDAVTQLSREMSLPFRLSRLTSGREVIIEIPRDELVKLIADRIRKSEDVDDVSVASTGEITVRYAGTSAPSARGDDAAAGEFAAALIGDKRLTVSARASADNALTISPEYDRIISNLVEDFNARKDVAYAQPNFEQRHYEQ